MQSDFPNIFMFFTITGVLWWGWLLMKVVDYLGIRYADKHNTIYYSTLENKNYDFRVTWPKKTINEVDAKPTRINISTDSEEKVTLAEMCTKCKPKPKWERTNAEETDDSTEDI